MEDHELAGLFRMARDVAETLYYGTESWEKIAEEVAYLFHAILTGNVMELVEWSEAHETFKYLFAPDHKVWDYIAVQNDGYER